MAVESGTGEVGDLVERVRTRLASAGGEAGVAELAAAVRAEARGVVGDADVLAAVRALQREFVGAGPLEPLLRDPATSDVLVTAPDAVWVDRGAGLERAAVAFADEDAVRRLAQRLAAAAGRRLDDASPYVDARLPGSGVRLHAVLPPVPPTGRVSRCGCSARRGTISTRCRPVAPSTPPGARCSRRWSRHGWRSWSRRHRVREDDAALAVARPGRPRRAVGHRRGRRGARPRHPHVVRLVARPANVEGAGTVLLRDLVRQALRMRPDRLVVGEVRGAEVRELLAALNTGHDGGAGRSTPTRRRGPGAARGARGPRRDEPGSAAQPARGRDPGRPARPSTPRRPAGARGGRGRAPRRRGGSGGRPGVGSRGRVGGRTRGPGRDVRRARRRGAVARVGRGCSAGTARRGRLACVRR